MSFFGDLQAGQLLDQLAGWHLKREEIRASTSHQTQADRDELLNTPTGGAQPSAPSQPSQPSGRVTVGGVELNKTALYVAVAALVVALILKLTD